LESSFAHDDTPLDIDFFLQTLRAATDSRICGTSFPHVCITPTPVPCPEGEVFPPVNNRRRHKSVGVAAFANCRRNVEVAILLEHPPTKTISPLEPGERLLAVVKRLYCRLT